MDGLSDRPLACIGRHRHYRVGMSSKRVDRVMRLDALNLFRLDTLGVIEVPT